MCTPLPLCHSYVRVHAHDNTRTHTHQTRHFILSTINLAMVVFSALMIWRLFMVGSLSDSPIVVVLSDSMATGFYRGDLLFLSNHDDKRYEVGDIVVFKVDGRDIPIVHRVITSHARDDEQYGKDVLMLTKGDANQVDDLSLYRPGQRWVEKRHLIGRARLLLPYVGFVTILMNDYPLIKYGLLAVLGLYSIVTRSEE